MCDNSEVNVQTDSTIHYDRHVTANRMKNTDQIENAGLSILGSVWNMDLQNDATDDNNNVNITEPHPTLGSIDQDLSLLCNFLGNDLGTVTKI